MFRALVKLFVPRAERLEGEEQRKVYGLFTSTVGLVINAILGILKLIVGILSGSVAIVGDAVNNLTDLVSSGLSILSFKIAAKKPDENHPFGHARIEYLFSTILAMIIIYVGGQFFFESFKKIFSPVEINPTTSTYIALYLSILLKLWLYFFYKYMAKQISTVILTANAQDSLSDVLSSSVILISVLLSELFGIFIDGYIGVLVALFIMKSGFDILKGGIDLLVGKKLSNDATDQIKRWIFSHQGVLGVHDLIVHDYGSGHKFASVHIEVDSRSSLVDAHDMIDRIENRAVKHLGLQLVVHIDPVDVSDPKLQELKSVIEGIVLEIHPDLSIHDFRLVRHHEKNLLIFDCVIPSHTAFNDDDLKEEIQAQLNRFDPLYTAKITFDRNYVRSKTH